MSTNQYTFVPAIAFITAISNSNPAVFTFSSPHTFVPGEIVSFRSSKQYGMYEINNLDALVLSTTSNTITVSLNTSNFTPFNFIPELEAQYVACVVPSSSGQLVGTSPPGNILEDAFDNLPTNQPNN